MERRAHPRYVVSFGAEVHTERGVIPASTRDVSRGGCQLASDRPLREDETVRIDLVITVDGIQEVDFPRLHVRGHIQWTAEGEEDGDLVHIAGVQFQGVTQAQGDWLEGILAKHRSE
jgi:hypothetical protein